MPPALPRASASFDPNTPVQATAPACQGPSVRLARHHGAGAPSRRRSTLSSQTRTTCTPSSSQLRQAEHLRPNNLGLTRATRPFAVGNSGLWCCRRQRVVLLLQISGRPGGCRTDKAGTGGLCPILCRQLRPCENAPRARVCPPRPSARPPLPPTTLSARTLPRVHQIASKIVKAEIVNHPQNEQDGAATHSQERKKACVVQ